MIFVSFSDKTRLIHPAKYMHLEILNECTRPDKKVALKKQEFYGLFFFWGGGGRKFPCFL